MFWEIVAWLAVALLTVFRVAIVVGVVALVVLIVRSLRAPSSPCATRAHLHASSDGCPTLRFRQRDRSVSVSCHTRPPRLLAAQA